MAAILCIAFCLFFFLLDGAVAHIITAAPRRPLPTNYAAVGVENLFGGHQLFPRDTDSCDNEPPPNGFHCATGTCYTGSDGFIGCCSTTSCYARTTCIDYASNPTTSCDPNYGGCLQCSNSGLPYCYTQTNTIANQFVFWCNTVPGTQTVGWANTKVGSMADPPPVSTTSSSRVTSSTTASPASTTISSVSSTSSSGAGTMTTSPTSTPTAAPAPSGSSSISTGAIAGIAVGSASGVALILVALWFCCRRRKSPPFAFLKRRGPPTSAGDPDTEGPYQPNNNRLSDENTLAGSSFVGKSKPGSPRPPANDVQPEMHHIATDRLGSVVHSDANRSSQRYTVTNPDAILISPSGTINSPRAGAVEAPTEYHASPKISPLTGSFGSPQNSSTGWPSPMSSRARDSSQISYIPYTPSHYNSDPPSSAQKSPPPNLPQPYSAATLAPYTPAHGAGKGGMAYTPSNYQPDVPGSTTRTQPASLPQAYSTATLESKTSSRNEFSSWPYLSAENALAGGWTNQGSPRKGQQEGL